MNQQKQPTDLDLGRAWLELAGAAHDRLAGALDRGYVAAMIGDGYARLAQARAALQAAGLEPISLRLTSEMPPGLVTAVERAQRAAAEARPHDDEPKPKSSLAHRLIATANAVYGNDTGNVLDAPTGHGLAAVVRELGEGPLVQTEWGAAQFRKLADELEIAGRIDRG